MKKCSVCLTEKELSNFQKDKYKSDGLRPDCKDCRKNYYQLNKNKIKKNDDYKKRVKGYNKTYYEKNKQEILENKKKYWKENKESIYEYVDKNRESINFRRKNYVKNRLKTDPIFKLKHNIRVLIYFSFKNGYKKNSNSVKILGCDFDFFKSYIESKFKEGMTWDNHGQSNIEKRWQLDHIIPISSAKSIEDIYTLNHYSNFQPLWESDNKSKGNR